MKKGIAIILIICLLVSMGSVCLAVDVGPGVVPMEPDGNYPQYGEPNDTESTVTIELSEKGNGILFTVTDAETGEPIEGATFTERLVTEEKPDLTKAETNDAGQYYCEQPIYTQGRDYVFVVSAVGYLSSDEIPVTYSKGLVEVKVELKRITTPTTFVVENEIGEPVESAQVIVGDTVLRQMNAYMSNENGFAQCELADGIYTVQTTHPHHEDYTGTVTIDSSKETTHTERIVMQRKRFDTGVYVLDENGAPVADVVVTMGGQAVRTDGYGYAEILGLYAGNYPVTATVSGYAQYTGTAAIPSEGDTLTIRMSKTGEEPQPSAGPTQQPEGGNGNGTDQGNAAPPAGQPSKNPAASASTTAGKYDGLPVDIAFLVRYEDGTAAAGLDMELHSRVKYGKTDQDGWAEFPNVEMGRHIIYIKDQDSVLASREFDLSRDRITNLLLAGGTGITVRDGVASIVVELTVLEDGTIEFIAVREGYRDKDSDAKDGIVITDPDAGGRTKDGWSDGSRPFVDEEESICKPVCIMTSIFGHPTVLCMFLGLPCWAWIIILTVAIVTIILVIVVEKRTGRKDQEDTDEWEE